MQLTPVGPDAVLVACKEPTDLAVFLRERRLAREVVPGADTVLLDGLQERDALRAVLDSWVPGADSASPEPVDVPVRYDGEDLAAVAELLGESVEAVVRRHQETDWISRFCGFAPGFAYLGGWDVRVPRLSTPRTKVPPGAVGLADGWCGIYPVASPGGWQLIGHTDVALWDAGRESPALLAPGTSVRFVEVP